MSEPRYVLGLDVGVASVGWSIVQLDKHDAPCGVLAMGSLLFEAGTEGTIADIEKGKDQPRNVQRRTARLMRRQIWRRARRKRKLLRSLIEHKLLPPVQDGGALKRPAEIDAYVKSIDVATVEKWGKDHAARQNWPYLLRAAACRERVEPYEFGRALYHLAQRRGFLSNRRTDATKKKDEDRGVVKTAIGELQTHIEAMPNEPRTLGGYLASLDTNEQRLRGRWTSRAMYQSEFESMWSEQARHHRALLTEAARNELERAIFYQRPLKDQSHLIGRCSLVEGEPRAPIAMRAYQRFRLVQIVNNIEVGEPDKAIRPLTDSERSALIGALSVEGDLSFTVVKKLLGLPRKTAINLEEGKDDKIIGNRTDAKLREAMGEPFDRLTDVEKDKLVESVRSFRSIEALEKHAKDKWGLKGEAARLLAGVNLEEARGSVSLAAIRKLMPLLEQGMTYGQARREVFPGSYKATTAHAKLPPVQDVMEELRNPSVLRAITQVRALVNQIIGKYGKPHIVRTEFARDLKNPRGVRERITRQNRDREKLRDSAKARAEAKLDGARPSREDIEKALLFDECGGICPYTGRAIDFDAMFGRHPQVDIEHIWPRSRCLDDSILNKTLCYAEENRARKRGRTPFEAYGGGSLKDNELFGEMLDRVGRFKGDLFVRREKLRRFAATEIDPGFENRHLSDTRFIARAVADYLGLLYGGRNDAEGKRRIETPTGGLTAWLRTGWGLGRLLGDSAEKNRSDHRHHAIDALVVALSDNSAVKRLSDAAREADKLGKRRAFEQIQEPWPGFGKQAQEFVDKIIVAHRQSRKISGPLHDQTIYSKPIGFGDNRGHRVRKDLSKLSPAEIAGDRIVDKRALAAIRAKLVELGAPNPDAKTIGQIFGNPANAPLIKGHADSMVRLRKVRVTISKTPVLLGKQPGAKYVLTEGNHHSVIYATKDAKGQEKWVDEPATLVDAVNRRDAKQPVVCRNLGDGKQFVFSLAPNDFVEIDPPRGDGSRQVYRIVNLSEGQNELRLHTDARAATELRGKKSEGRKDERVIVDGERLRKLNARKVRVTYLGELRWAND